MTAGERFRWPPRVLRRARRRMLWCRETWDAAKRVASEAGMTPLAVLREQAWLYRHFGLDQYAYYRYRLYEPGRSRDDKTTYLPDSVPENARLWKLLTPPRYRLLYDNKLVFHRFFAAAGLPLAPLFGVYAPRFGRAEDGAPLGTADELRRLLERVGGSGFVFKPVEGIMGDRVLVFAGPDPAGGWRTLAGERFDAEQLVARTLESTGMTEHNPGADPRPFLIEARIRPHAELAELLGPTLCSVRVQTLIRRDGRPVVLAAVFKLQAGTAGVDHLMHGGVGCWVDPESGALGRGRTRGHDRDITTIPGTERSFVGYTLPDWPAVRDLALRAADAFPWARSIGWDIGVGERGPVLIEGNERWSPSLIQMPAPAGLLSGELRAVRDELDGKGRHAPRG
jgi:Sugar-transfer associated ATP-grasp